ncbi:hypothetical protein GWC95_09660 [Sediminibacterium roseum]|uniref:Uncharacterized protein n=1 Tax=Sediminibacterium roseum TaxID=1978412 RepID=A0ABW9ZST9_9BACT|nr:hypothetical protein [Sediminibacterium roseum]NCI50189.1 hypothetical protein [Sediminibacterium roseum]
MKNRKRLKKILVQHISSGQSAWERVLTNTVLPPKQNDDARAYTLFSSFTADIIKQNTVFTR